MDGCGKRNGGVHRRDFGRRPFGDRRVAGAQDRADFLVGSEDESDQLAARTEAGRDLFVGVGQQEEARIILARNFLHQRHRVGTDREQMRTGLQHGGCGAEHCLQLAQGAGVLLCRVKQNEQRPALGLVVQVDDDVALIGQEEIRRAVAPFEHVFKLGCGHALGAPDDGSAFVIRGSQYYRSGVWSNMRVQLPIRRSRAMPHPPGDGTR